MDDKNHKLRNALCRMSLQIFTFLAFAPYISGQAVNGSIYGTVSDSSGAAVREATVTATNTATSISETTRTDSSGEYVFFVLDPGNYKVSVLMSGFQSQTQSDLRLDASQNVDASFALQPGSMEQNITVEAQTALVDTRESQIGSTVDQKRIQNLPLNGRNAYDLVQLVPGVTNYTPDVATGSRAGTQVTVNGITHNSAFYLDSTYNTDVQLGGNLLPNPDALQGLRVLTSNYDAEFGRLAGGVINAITRSGTSQYHGLAYEYLRNNIFNAKNWFLTSVTPLRQNQFGGNFGGPVPATKGLGFFFLSYQGLRIRQPASVAASSLIIPTGPERAGDFRNTPLTLQPNVSCLGVQYQICPNLLDPVSQNVLKFVPLGDPTPGQNYGHPPEQAADANINVDQGLARVDLRLGQSHQLSGMLFESRGTADQPTLGGNRIVSFSGMTNYQGQYNGVVSEVWTVSPSRVNSLRAYYTLNHYVVSNIFGNKYLLPDLGSQAAVASDYTTQPYFNIMGYWQMGSNLVGPANTASKALGLSDTLNLALGRHELKLGGAFAWNNYSNTGAGGSNGLFTFNGATTGNALADFLLGKANSMSQDNGVYARLHAIDPSIFAQLNWRVTRGLTLNLGLRWEYYPPLIGQNNTGTFVAGVQSTRFPAAPLGLLTSGDTGIRDGILHTPWNTFAPRLGFAYDLFANGLTSLRGAYGIFYSTVDSIQFMAKLVQQPFSRSVTVSKTPNLVTPFAPAPDPFPYNLTLSNAAFSSGANLFSLSPSGRDIPSVQQFSLGVRQQYSSRWSSEINYVGNLGRHLYITYDQNSPLYDATCTSRTCGSTDGQNNRRPYQPTPNTYTFAAIMLSAPAVNSSYHSLQATLAREFDRNFTLQASFVWSKATGYGALTDAYALNSSRGVLDINVPYNFVASYIWFVPSFHHLGQVGKQLLNDWQISGLTTLRSGQPFNVVSGTDTNFDGTINDRPNIVGNPHLAGSRDRVAKKNAYFDTSAFATPPSGSPYGNTSFNFLYGPKFVNTDLSIFKTFPVDSDFSIQLRGELFNAFNNVNMSAPNSTKSSPLFGTISSAAAPRILQMALRFSF
jgi:Carboxypeptidase regulatory-like domain